MKYLILTLILFTSCYKDGPKEIVEIDIYVTKRSRVTVPNYQEGTTTFFLDSGINYHQKSLIYTSQFDKLIRVWWPDTSLTIDSAHIFIRRDNKIKLEIYNPSGLHNKELFTTINQCK